MAYVPIINAEIDPDSPLTTGLFFKLRDNTDFSRNTATGAFTAAGFTSTNFLPAAALVNNSVTVTQVGANAIHQDELNSTTVELTSDPGGVGDKTSTITLDTSLFAFTPIIKWIDNGGSPNSVQLTGYQATSTTLERVANVFLDAAGSLDPTPGITISMTRVDASPPWDIGDGEIPFFLFAEIDSSGRVVYISSAVNPPWDIYNEAENIVKRKMNDEELINSYGIKKKELGSGRKYRLQRSLIDSSTGTFEDKIIEVTPQFKNTHMGNNAHPFKYNRIIDKDKKLISNSGNRIVLVDPCETLSLLELSSAGYSINDLIINGDLNLGTTHMNGRATPHKDIMIVPLKWKNTRST